MTGVQRKEMLVSQRDRELGGNWSDTGFLRFLSLCVIL
jgi:hypothetical protein